ncbi:ATP-dependent DNA helicase RecQ-like isoform X2 [Ostrea edulis]|uniref:ATP-dependent DNA helicase RecQ-like isoform X2 n=1 Tax=Ostrea edulis TaxID=37623 RepID=UPI0024AF7ED9|nr:ATP-dependent DNA helicase RecQ-like isoform X2 [Ostrea edulis]
MAAPTIENIVEELLPDFGVNALKPEQKEIISNITKKKDCIAVLPTGFGKSLPFQVYAAAQKRTSREAGHVLVCSPLIGLMKDQTKKLSRISYLSVGYKGFEWGPMYRRITNNNDFTKQSGSFPAIEIKINK